MHNLFLLYKRLIEILSLVKKTLQASAPLSTQKSLALGFRLGSRDLDAKRQGEIGSMS